jgi:DNA mismatch endonuclease (patch repair protein)
MTDPLSPEERSERMSRVRSTGNKSTEERAAEMLDTAGIVGWERQPKGVPGRPDFYFPETRLMVFVDGCFWHACPVCKRRNPTNRAEFWREKIDANRRRDNRQRRKLRAEGYHVMRVWEHEVKKDAWVKRLVVMMRRLQQK